MLASVDGKISTGGNDERDVDKDLPKVDGVREGLHQYYEIEKRTDVYSLNTGRVMAKIGINARKNEPKKMPVSFIIIDNKPHLNKNGVFYLTKWVKKLYLVTTNKNHPAYKIKADNVEIIYYNGKINFKDLFAKLRNKYKIQKITIQSGGTLNSTFIREGLIDRLSIVVAPCVIGGRNSSTIADGKDIMTEKDLKQIKAVKLKKAEVLKKSYLHLQYNVINK